jgi:hypothetical protein
MAEQAPAALSAPHLCQAHAEGVTTISYVPGKGGCITAGGSPEHRARPSCSRHVLRAAAGRPIGPISQTPHLPPAAQAPTSGSWRAR